MTKRGWRSERVLNLLDPNGKAVALVVGLTRDQHGRWQRAIGIGDGPSAMLPADATITELKINLDDSRKDLDRVEGRR